MSSSPRPAWDRTLPASPGFEPCVAYRIRPILPMVGGHVPVAVVAVVVAVYGKLLGPSRARRRRRRRRARTATPRLRGWRRCQVPGAAPQRCRWRGGGRCRRGVRRGVRRGARRGARRGGAAGWRRGGSLSHGRSGFRCLRRGRCRLLLAPLALTLELRAAVLRDVWLGRQSPARERVQVSHRGRCRSRSDLKRRRGRRRWWVACRGGGALLGLRVARLLPRLKLCLALGIALGIALGAVVRAHERTVASMLQLAPGVEPGLPQ